MADKSWGASPSPPFRIRSNDSPADRAAARATAREARGGDRDAAMAARMEERAARREEETKAREAAREQRRLDEERQAAADPHGAAARRHRGSGRKDVVREQRDTRGYTTVVDADRIRALAKRGASITGLAGAFGVPVETIEAVLREGDRD
ncbi:hypothetical protein IFT82_07770 [Sphingomonas sp. CFBP 8760]|nr:hypothetical protein [Sphingomonas sp. CFBP 8760]